MMRSEHHAQAGQHSIKLTIAIRQCLGVCGFPSQLDSGFGRQLLTGLQQFGREIRGNHPCAGAGRGNRGVAATGGDVKDHIA